MVRLILALVAACLLLATPALAERASQPSDADGHEQWVEVHRATGLWSRDDKKAKLFRTAEPGARFKVVRPQAGSRLYVWDPLSKNYAYVDAADVGPIDSRKVRVRRDVEAEQQVGASSKREVEVRRPEPEGKADTTDRMPTTNLLWSGTAHVTMYTCVELGGCNRTASGVWPYEGVVAVDPRLIPLGSMVWIEGLGTFLAADTGSAIYGNRIDVYVQDYGRARQWGIRYLPAAAYVNR
jgi:3D (Asp-Asp-Asp) domain-containing protein